MVRLLITLQSFGDTLQQRFYPRHKFYLLSQVLTLQLRDRRFLLSLEDEIEHEQE
jgi:hypothetical protein